MNLTRWMEPLSLSNRDRFRAGLAASVQFGHGDLAGGRAGFRFDDDGDA